MVAVVNSAADLQSRCSWRLEGSREGSFGDRAGRNAPAGGANAVQAVPVRSGLAQATLTVLTVHPSTGSVISRISGLEADALDAAGPSTSGMQPMAVPAVPAEANENVQLVLAIANSCGCRIALSRDRAVPGIVCGGRGSRCLKMEAVRKRASKW